MRGGLSALRIDYFFVIGKMRLAWINYLYISNVIPLLLTVQVPTPQIAQTNSNNSSGVFECVWPFVKLEVKRLTLVTSLVFWGAWNYITFIQKLVALIKVPKLHRNIKNLSLNNFIYVIKTKDVLLNSIDHEYIRCDADLVVNGRF